MKWPFYQWFLIGAIVTLLSVQDSYAQRQVQMVETDISTNVTSQSRGLKRKVAIGRFSNETKYGKGLFYDKANDPMGKQALDILSSKLAASEKFILLERNDVGSLLTENGINGTQCSNIGADYVIIGSITEFGRKTVGKSNGLSSEKSQIVEATISIRLVDTSTGLIVYSEEGKGEAELTTKNTLFTSQAAGFDATLSDKAISAAIGQLVGNIVDKCTDKPWRTYILSADSDGVIIAGGQSQGLNAGDEFAIKTKGKRVKNPQTGIELDLPGKTVGKIKIIQSAGDTPETEYSIVEVVSSDVNLQDNYNNLIIEEIKTK